MDIAPADLARVRERYTQGHYRRAYDESRAFGPLRSWSGTAARLIGGRLAIQLGAPKLGRRMHLAAFRATPAHPEAIYYHARYRMERFGPLSTWRFMRNHPDWSDAPPELHTDWLALHAFIIARLRDFDRAERLLNRAEAITPDRPWPCIERSGVYEFADRLDDAMAAARRALELHPWFRPGVQSVAHLLLRQGRDRAALDFLTEADTHLESSLVAAQLASLQTDLGHYADARRTLDRYAELSPLIEPEVAKWLSARRADAAYFLGDWPAAAGFAREVKDEFYDQFAERLLASGGRQPPVQESGGSQQESGSNVRTASATELTPDSCSLAPEQGADAPRSPRGTLALNFPPHPAAPSVYELLARYWNHPLPPTPETPPTLDGLPDAGERHRAEENGWVAREFTLSREAAVALIERRVPFIITLVEAGFSQARLCVGAEPMRGTVSVVDGHDRRPVDAPTGSLLKRFNPFGPRCLALVPASEANKLDGLPELPEAEAREALYAVQKPLLAHDRAAAESALRVMGDRLPGSKFILFGELALARYDAHPLRLIAVYDKLLARFPHESSWVLAKSGMLRELNRMPEREALLEAEGTRLDAEPMVSQTLAQTLLPHPHRQHDAVRLLRRSVQDRPTAAAGYYLLATQWWEERQFDEAAELYRFACTLEEREDQFADAYFRAARATEQVPEAIRLFQQRAGRAAVPIPAATRALYHALLDRDEPQQASAAVDQAINKLAGGGRKPPVGAAEATHPTPTQQYAQPPQQGAYAPRSPEEAALGELLLFRAECHAAADRFAEAEADLTAAKGLVPPVAWHKAAARVARIKPDLATAGAHYLEVVKLEPLAMDSHRTLTALLADTDGRAAARTHLAQACQRFPHYHPLLKLRAEVLSGDTEGDPERALQDMLAEYPDDAWALRQRALVLAERKRTDAALADVTRAGELEPNHVWYYSVLAQVHKRADRTAEARDAARAGLRLNIDQEPLIVELVQLGRGRREKREALDFVEAELRRQPHTGEGLVAFVSAAHLVFQGSNDPDDHTRLLETLEQILDERADLWSAWSVAVQQLAGLGRLEEAHSLAREATDRFPLLGKLWLDLAQVCHALGNADGRLDALRQAVAVSPGWSLAAREMADALDDAEQRAEAIAVLERATVRNPLDALAHGFLAERLWDEGRSREALDRAKTAVRLEPGYEWAWHAVQLWSDRMEEQEEPAELTRELTRDRAGDPRAWLRLARMLHHPRHNDEVLVALDRAIALDPKNVEAHDLKAERLAEMGRFDAALEAACPPQFTDDMPVILQGREAWVLARRGDYGRAINSMDALVKLDPDYVWGWHQLADWYNETGRSGHYLEAASELVRLQPHHPTGWTMRGEAKLQTGDRDGGKDDLREALKISATYSPAAAILFDACLADEEYRDASLALAVLQEHAGGPEVAVKQIQLACRLEDAETALRAFGEICEGPGTSAYPIQAALNELRAAGWEDRAHKALRESWQSGGPFHPWAPIFWIDSPEGRDADPGDRLRAADAVIKAYPKFVPGHDCKAEQLALAGRYDEALAACKPADLGDPAPLELRGRAAWIEARRGDRAKAIAIMRQLVGEQPGFVHGWRQLAAWYDTTGRPRDCLEASEQFVKLEPSNPMAYIYRGEARRGVADRRGAMADFQKAFDIDPTFEAAGLNLITEQLAAGDTTSAARTLAALQETANGPLVRLRAVQVACRQGSVELALAYFRDLTADPDASRGTLREAVLAFDAEGWSSKLTDELKALTFEPNAGASIAGLWADRAVAGGAAEQVSEQLPELLAQNPDAGREVLLTYLWALAEAGKPVQAIVQKYNDVLRADDTSWARAGASLVAAGHHGMASAWLADWRERPGVEAWMLRPLVTVFHLLDQDERAIDVCRAAVKLGGPEELLAEFRGWLAIDLALSGQPEEALAHTSKIDSVTVSDAARLLLAMAQSVILVKQAGPDGKAAAFKEAKDALRVAGAACAARDVPAGAARAYRRVVSCVAGEASSLSAKLWAVWQRIAPWVK